MGQSQFRAFVKDISNPITAARLDAGMSMNALAKKLGLSREYMSRAEQGTYVRLNPKLIAWVAESANIPVRSVIDRYANFQNATRITTKEEINPRILERGESDWPGYMLFTRWREDYWSSATSFSIALCIHPETVKSYEDGSRREMPERIKRVLQEAEMIESNWSDG